MWVAGQFKTNRVSFFNKLAILLLYTILFIIDPPSPPRKPTEVSGMSESSLTLAWKASEKDGGSKIIEYIVEIKETNQETWKRCGTTIGDCTNIHIENLVKDMSYEFRICARNEVGTSTYLETEDKIIVGRKISKCLITLDFISFGGFI